MCKPAGPEGTTRTIVALPLPLPFLLAGTKLGPGGSKVMPVNNLPGAGLLPAVGAFSQCRNTNSLEFKIAQAKSCKAAKRSGPADVTMDSPAANSSGVGARLSAAQ